MSNLASLVAVVAVAAKVTAFKKEFDSSHFSS
jgi:hypothetical protein